MAALFRGLRAGRVLWALGSGMVTPQCSRVQRGFRQAARLRLPDDLKTEQQPPTASSSPSQAPQQHFPAHQSEPEAALAQETPAPELAMPESASAPSPEVAASAPTHEAEVSSASEVEACSSAAEQGVTDSPPSPASRPEQEASASVTDPEASAHTPELETSASAQEVPESAPEEVAPAQAASASVSEEEASVQAASASEQEASEPKRSHSDQESEGDESDGYESEEELQARILSTALEFVPQHGWSADAISAAAETLGLSSAAAGMFSNGAGDLVIHFISQSNAQLAQLLAEHHNQVQQGQAEPKETAEFLRYAVEARLRMLIPHIDSWPQAMSILLLPHNIPNSLKHLSTLIDDIWYYAGDRSTDMNWYTRRAALTGVYNTTELVMLQDSSPDFQDTWAFLDKRIQDIVNMANTAKQVQATGEAVVQGIMGAAVTLSNLAGMSQRR